MNTPSSIPNRTRHVGRYQWRIRLAQQPHKALPTQIRVQIGSSFREFGPVDARQIADRLHDLADRIEQLEQEAKCLTQSNE